MAPCIRSLMKLSGVTWGKKSTLRPIRRERKVKTPTWSTATTTKSVGNLFENMFTGQLANCKNNSNKLPKRRRCGVCDNYQQPDCGICYACKDMIKFGGKGIQKQACIRRKCPNLAIQEADDSDPENEEQYESLTEDQTVQDQENEDFKELKKDVIWEEDKIFDGQKAYYKSVTVGNEKIQVNDYVLLEHRDPAVPLQICKVVGE